MAFRDIYNNNAWFGKESMQMPGLASASNFFGNLKPGLKFGFTGNLGSFNPANGGMRGTPFNFKTKDLGDGVTKTAWNPQMSLGGMLSSGYGAVGGGIMGAGLGAAASSFVEGGNPIAGAAIGAGVGAAALFAAPVAVGLAARGGLGILKNTDKILAGIGSAGINLAKGAGKIINSGLRGVADSLIDSSLTNPLTRYASAAGGIVSKLVTRNPEVPWVGQLTTNVNGSIKYQKGVELSGLGKALMVGGFLKTGIQDAYHEVINQQMGQKDNYMSSVTPRVPVPDAGATGDLVFAMNANRRG